MSLIKLVKEHQPNNSFRVQSVIGKFDLPNSTIKETFEVDFQLPTEWQIGLIVGGSGTGKTTLMNEIFGKQTTKYPQLYQNSIIDDMPKDKPMDQICHMFNSVGFSSPPSWLKPFHVLSNGEKMRAELAYLLLCDNEMVVFDEFTSVVDRQIAQIGSLAVQKAVRKTDKKFVAVTCHHDVEEWLNPDWVLDTDIMKMRPGKKKGQTSSSPSTNQKIQLGPCLESTII